MIEALASLYLFIALFAATMTYVEQQANRGCGLHFKALGFLACAFWPALLIMVVIAIFVRPPLSS